MLDQQLASTVIYSGNLGHKKDSFLELASSLQPLL